MPKKEAIVYHGVSKHFGQNQALNQVSFEVPQGCVFGLVGPNGAGKTTLFSLTAGFLKATKGSIQVLGHDIRKISPLLGKLSILPQDAQFQANVPLLEQLIFFSRLLGNNLSEAEAQASRALAIVRLEEYAKKGARVLSHGMAKRLGIAQAFLGSPEVILLDEPTAGLDPASAQNIRDLIETLHGKATVVISSHDLKEIQRICEFVAILDKGRLIESKRISEITQTDSHLRLGFTRNLSPEEISSLQKIPGVLQIASAGEHQYAINFDLAVVNKQSQDELVKDLVRELMPTGAIPRSIEAGQALETHFLEVTRTKT